MSEPGTSSTIASRAYPRRTTPSSPSSSLRLWNEGQVHPLEIENLDNRLPVIPAETSSGYVGDGVLGQGWFRDRIWTFDYATGELLFYPNGEGPDLPDASSAPLGFPTRDGMRQTNYPRITVEIDGESVELLFDTGATVVLSEAALEELGDGRAAIRETSFIAASTFDRWRERNPDWRVIEGADETTGGDPIIEVPSVTIAGFEVGPVWFARRADPNFHEWFSQWMDKRIDGALGGSALKYFRVTVDYPQALVYFELLDSAGEREASGAVHARDDQDQEEAL